jgi:hypothetical protein
MKGIRRVEEILVETGAYTDLDKPVILTSGELGIYYINTEKMLQDDGEWKRHGEDSKAMIVHALRTAEHNGLFRDAIDIIAEHVRNLFIGYGAEPLAISGGQRRDWIFSGSVAARLGIPHISLYKQEEGKPDRIEYMHKGVRKDMDSFEGLRVIPLVDLITEGSSVYRQEDGRELGWIPMLRQKGAVVDDLVAVVSRLQGGEEMLRQHEVNAYPFVLIGESFLREHSRHPGRALEYISNPKAWSESYLREHGALDLLGAFDPKGTKIPRAKRFIERYEIALQESGRFRQLEDAVEKKYGKTMRDVLGV